MGPDKITDLINHGSGPFHKSLKKSKIRKLSYFMDGAGKWRYIAIGDWISQSTLIPLHHVLMSILKKIPQDCTYEQHKVHE
jgi:hypothetical protein